MEEIEKFLKNSKDCEDLVLILASEQKCNLLNFFNENEIYNDLARRFFHLYDYDVSKIEEAIEYSKFMEIPKDIFQDNLRLENPVPLKFRNKNAPMTEFLLGFVEGDFYDEYEKRKNNPNIKR